MAVPNEVHQADLLFLPRDRVGRKTFRYALTVASLYKEAEPLISQTAAEVADGLARIYKRSPLRWPKLLQIDPGRDECGEPAAGKALCPGPARSGRYSQGPRRRGALEQDPRRAVVWAPIRPRDAPSFVSTVNKEGGSAA